MKSNPAVLRETETQGQGRCQKLIRCCEFQAAGESWEIPSSLFTSKCLKLTTALEVADKDVQGSICATVGAAS